MFGFLITAVDNIGSPNSEELSLNLPGIVKPIRSRKYGGKWMRKNASRFVQELSKLNHPECGMFSPLKIGLMTMTIKKATVLYSNASGKCVLVL